MGVGFLNLVEILFFEESLTTASSATHLSFKRFHRERKISLQLSDRSLLSAWP